MQMHAPVVNVFLLYIYLLFNSKYLNNLHMWGKDRTNRQKSEKRKMLPWKLTIMGPPPPAAGAPSSPSPLTEPGR
jgi:hypothetical protein